MEETLDTSDPTLLNPCRGQMEVLYQVPGEKPNPEPDAYHGETLGGRFYGLCGEVRNELFGTEQQGLAHDTLGPRDGLTLAEVDELAFGQSIFDALSVGVDVKTVRGRIGRVK